MAHTAAANETINALKAIFEKHKHERVCVIGTMCCGKTTLVKQLPQYSCADMDDLFWPQISKADIARFSARPITKAMLEEICAQIYAKVTVSNGHPLYSIVVHDCEAVVYLDISEPLLKAHCEKRGDTAFADAMFVKQYIETQLSKHKAKNDKVFYSLNIVE